MEKEFVPYELALKMKQLGFDKPCFAYYNKSKKRRFDRYTTSHWPSTCLAPTFSQAFRWFREKYNILSRYEEAELACLEKLIEIVKISNQ